MMRVRFHGQEFTIQDLCVRGPEGSDTLARLLQSAVEIEQATRAVYIPDRDEAAVRRLREAGFKIDVISQAGESGELPPGAVY